MTFSPIGNIAQGTMLALGLMSSTERRSVMRMNMEMVTRLVGDPSTRNTPKALRWLSRSKLAAPLWTAARIWLGVMWIQAGVSKLWGAENPGFLHHNGSAVASYAAHGATAGVASYTWWGTVLHSFVVPNSGWIGILFAVAEFVVGIGLAVGLLTPLMAFGALLMNVIYMLSGTAGVNPVYALSAILLLATWRTSGWIGLDGLLVGFIERRRKARSAEQDGSKIRPFPRVA